MHATALHFLLLTVAGRVNRRQLAAIDYLREENRVLRAQPGNERLKLNDAQRLALAVKGRALGRTALGELASIATPDTILGWYRKADRCQARRDSQARLRPPAQERGRPRAGGPDGA